jgi:phosphatidylserine/phosphatidylglycerophosphate/cardiolipin synthase-like enzyme
VTVVLREGETVERLLEQETGGVLIDGRDYYLAFWEHARRAKKWILISGWQFDSEVRLLRGDDMARAGTDDIRLVPFLNQLCERNPDLHIYLLAWDFNVVYAMEREYYQGIIFKWGTHDRIHFVFDGDHVVGASQHHKIVVVDGQIAFTGGIDLCENRWDDRAHHRVNPDRDTSLDHHYEPYHDVQAWVTGPAVKWFVEFLRARWQAVSEVPLLLPEVEPYPLPPLEGALPVPARRVGMVRTIATRPGEGPMVREVQKLYVRSILAAERLIYIESQYVSARAICEALIRRMRDAAKPKLEMVVMVPVRPEAVKEEVAIGVAQTKLLRELIEVARATGHALGIYDVDAGGEHPVYMHSKLMVVDDRLLTIGSANCTNRSFGLDTEVNVAWECDGEDARVDEAVRAAIRTVRCELMLEHCHGCGAGDLAAFEEIPGLVGRMEAIIERGGSRLHRHELSTIFDDADVPFPEMDLSAELDPERPIERELFEIFSTDHRGVFARGIGALGRWLMKKAGLRTSTASSEKRVP